MVIGIFGGTFDPPHRGHLGVAKNALDSGRVDEVWFVPCLTHRFGKQPAPFEDRLAMCDLLIEGEPMMRVSDMEAKLERPGYTLDLVLALGAAHPGYALRILAGADIYFDRDKWHQYDEIARLAPPLYVAREGVAPIPEPTLPAPAGMSSTELRVVLARGELPVEEVPERVLKYIENHGLYKEES